MNGTDALEAERIVADSERAAFQRKGTDQQLVSNNGNCRLKASLMCNINAVLSRFSYWSAFNALFGTFATTLNCGSTSSVMSYLSTAPRSTATSLSLSLYSLFNHSASWVVTT